MNQDPVLIAYIIFVAIFFLMENIVMARSGARMQVFWNDRTLFFVIAPFYLTLIAAPLEYLYLPHPTAIGFYVAGGFLFILGTLLRMKAHLDLGKAFSISIDRKSDQQIVKVGLYRTIRHPLYLAILMILVAAPLFLADTLTWLLTSLGIAGMLIRIRLEEKYLTQEFKHYADYMQKTWKLIPWIY